MQKVVEGHMTKRWSCGAGERRCGTSGTRALITSYIAKRNGSVSSVMVRQDRENNKVLSGARRSRAAFQTEVVEGGQRVVEWEGEAALHIDSRGVRR